MHLKRDVHVTFWSVSSRVNAHGGLRDEPYFCLCLIRLASDPEERDVSRDDGKVEHLIFEDLICIKGEGGALDRSMYTRFSRQNFAQDKYMWCVVCVCIRVE